jgi:hypothetical protein
MEHVRAGAGAHPGWGLSGAKRSNGDQVWSWSGFPGLRFLAMLKAARDLGLDPEAVNAAALR